MKKSITVIIAVIISVSVIAQDGNLKSKFYFRLGATLPSWKYLGNNGKSDWPDQIKRTGGVFEIGSIFMLNSIDLMDGMRLGINVDYLSLSATQFSVKGSNGGSYTFAFIGSKIGPSFSYSPVKHLVFDTYAKINPVWVSGSQMKVNDGSSSDQMYMGFMAMKYSFGLNVRYSVLMLGFEYNPGFVKLRYYDKDNNKLTTEYLGQADETNSKKSPVPAMNFTLGLNF